MRPHLNVLMVWNGKCSFERFHPDEAVYYYII